MEQTSFRVRTELNQTDPIVLNVPLSQTYDTIEILSLKLDQANNYKLFESGFGVICGRVSCSGFGIPNAKIGLFVEVESTADTKERLIYNYSSTSSTNNDGVQYNLLPNFVDDTCHQDVGTFPSKRQWLDSKETTVQIYENYYQFTTTSGPSGDFMIICPTGNAILHCDVDLSDIGTNLSQRPLDMEAKGYPANLFDSPTKFKKSTNLKELSQIYTQDKGLYVYPYWGEQTEYGDHIAITRVDFDIDYKFEPSCIFIGCAITDKGTNAVGSKCKPDKKMGKVSELVTSSGTLSMIRKTPSGKVEQFQVEGDQLIDEDGVWCYQIPMNLDYIKTDEFGNIVPTDDVDNGIPTRARVRFRFTLNETEEDATARKRCSYLVPNNPRIDSEHYPDFTKTLEPDYEFGSLTKEESFRDLFWNNVYTVKSYIPKLQTDKKVDTRNHTGIKWTSYAGDNNPFPFNSLVIKKSLTYKIICYVTKLIIELVRFLNEMLTLLGIIPCLLYTFLNKLYSIGFLGIHPFFILKPFRDAVNYAIPRCIGLDSGFCDDEVNRATYYPGCGKLIFTGASLKSEWINCTWKKTTDHHDEQEEKDCNYDPECLKTNATEAKNTTPQLMTCVENALIQEQEITAFNFVNDWINGTLYFPLWFRRISPKKKFFFGLFTIRHAKDRWCTNEKTYGDLRIHHACAIEYGETTGNTYNNLEGTSITPYTDVEYSSSTNYHSKTQQETGLNGIVTSKETMLEETIYYYVPLEYDASLKKNEYSTESKSGDVKLLFATDIVLLGNLKECNMYGLPQFFKYLESSTYNLPHDILDTNYDVTTSVSEDGENIDIKFDKSTNETGCDWSNTGGDQCDKPDGGLFYDIGCSTVDVMQKSCLNLIRVCEFGVARDMVKEVENLAELSGNDNAETGELIPDGFISYDELYNLDERAMFATMNHNGLKTQINTKNGLLEYILHYLYPENFDGSLYNIMQTRQAKKCTSNYRYNYNLESFSKDYYAFRFGEKPYFYINDNSSKSFPRYENSFYFYFGLKDGKTAINKFNEQFYAPCEDVSGEQNSVSINVQANDWCSEVIGGDENKNSYLEIDASGVETPYSIILNCTSNKSIGFTIDDITNEKIVICNTATYGSLNQNDYEYENPISCQFNIPNGDYELTLTDANGSILEVTFVLKNKYLNYKVSSMDFLVGNDTLLSQYGSYDGVAKATPDSKESCEFTGRCAIGGALHIYSITNNNEPLQDYRLTVYTDEVAYSYPSIVVQNGVVISKSGAGVLPDTNANDILIGLPYGDATYYIEVTQLCNGIDSNNSVKQSVYIDKAIEFKMYINDIDYSLILGWDGGVDSDGNVSGSITGWLEMSDETQYSWGGCQEAKTLINTLTSLLINNTEITLDGSPLGETYAQTLRAYFEGINWINIDAEDLIKELDLTITLEESDEAELIQEIKDALETFQEFKDDTIYSIRNTFIFNCEDDRKTLSLSASTSDSNYPLSYRIWGREEKEAENEDGESIQTLANGATSPEYLGETDGSTIEDIKSVSSIGIPTLSTTDSERFGNQNYIFSGTDICIATDNVSELPDKRKFPYYVAVQDGSGSTLPMGVLNFDGSNQGMFVVHFIDKIMSYELMYWSAFVDIPFYKLTRSEEETVCFINMDGILTGIIKNGIPLSVDNKGEVTFTEQLLGDEEIEIYNIDSSTTYEDAMPTKRVFNYAVSDESGFAHYVAIQATNINITSQYTPLEAKAQEVQIDGGSGCGIYETIYGDIKIELVDTSYNDCVEELKFLQVTCANSGENPIYYIFDATTHTYPLNQITMKCDEDTKAYVDMSSWNDTWDGENISILSYLTGKDQFEEYCDKEVKSETVDSENTTLIEETFGFGTTGVFDISNVSHNAFYIVTINDSNGRTISPVYDFTPIQGHFFVRSYVDEETQSTKYQFGLYIDDEIPYYLQTYALDVTIQCSSVQGINITINNANPFKSNPSVCDPTTDGYIAYDINEATYNNLLLGTFIENTTLIITDCTGLTHNCKINSTLQIC